jgi:hypothetical protein
METNYSHAWKQYLKSEQHANAEKILMKQGLKQPYIDNILRTAFDYGWKAAGVEIKPLP